MFTFFLPWDPIRSLLEVSVPEALVASRVHLLFFPESECFLLV